MILFQIFIFLLLAGVAVVVLQLLYYGILKVVETVKPQDRVQHQKKVGSDTTSSSDDFNISQKCVMVVTLGLLAEADKPMDARERLFILGVTKRLRLSDLALKSFYESKQELWKNSRHSIQYIGVILNTLSDDEKEWFVCKMDDLICDGRMPSEAESKLFADFISSMKITPERYMEIVETNEYYRKLTS
jgi:hypothetical protein